MAQEGAPPNNTHALKFDTPVKRKAMLEAYIKHCEAGYPDDFFEHCDMQTFRSYQKKFPVDFDTDAIRAARSKRSKMIYDMGIRGTMGIPISYMAKDGSQKFGKGFNAKSWQFIAMNMLGFRNRDDITTKGDKLPKGGFNIYVPNALPDDYDDKMKRPGAADATDSTGGAAQPSQPPTTAA